MTHVRAPLALALAFALASAIACDRRDRAPGVLADAAGFGHVVAEVLPAIVLIQAEAAPRSIHQLMPNMPGLLLPTLPFAAGSGVLFRDDGYIITNNHVVKDAERVVVVLHDRRWYEAEVIGRDPSTEVAVVRIGGSGFPTARLGDSDAVALGDWVLAMGSPLGLQFSVTAGIVSGMGRTLGILGAQAEQAAALEHFIQTDAALSPGNSGGPLINGVGEVIGINTAIATGRDGAGGYGFAVPANIARLVAEQLIEHGVVQRPFLGVRLTTVSPFYARSHGLPRVEGAVVMAVEPGSPADRSGLRMGDIIVELGGRRIGTVSDLQAQLARLEPGGTSGARIIRGAAERTINIRLGKVSSGVRGNGRDDDN